MSAPTKLFDAIRLGPFALSSRVVMAPLTKPRTAARHGAGAACGRVLPATRLSRPHYHGGKPDIAAGAGLSGHARHLFEGTGLWLAKSRRRRTCARRPDLPPALACRTHLQRLSAAGRRRAGCAVCDLRQGHVTFVNGKFVRTSRPRALELREIPGLCPGFSARRRERPGSRALTASRSTAPMAIFSTSSRRTAPTSVRMGMAVRSRTAQD